MSGEPSDLVLRPCGLNVVSYSGKLFLIRMVAGRGAATPHFLPLDHIESKYCNSCCTA